MAEPTSTYRLVETRLGGDLAAHVADLRRAGASWMKVRDDLAERTQIRVTPTTLINWFAEQKAS